MAGSPPAARSSSRPPGNTGTGLAIVARLKGYRVIAVMPDKMSKEKIDLLRAYGAEVVVAPTDVPPDSPQSYYRVADRLTEEIPGAFQPNQYRNQANPRAHYESTGPELWEQTAGRITHLVCGVGTGGTVTGTVRYLRERKNDLEVISADPEGSIYSGGSENVRPYLVEGVGEDFWPQTFDPSVVDRWITVSDRDSFLTARRLALTEGILAGGSGGLAVHAALQVAAEIEDPKAMIVVIVPDGGPLVPIEDLLRQLDAPVRLPRAGGQAGRRRCAPAQERRRRDPVARDVETHQRVRDAVSLLHEHGLSQLPVLSPHDPATVVGAISERGLLKRVAADPSQLDAEIVEVMEPPFAAVSTEDPVREAVELLVGDQQALLVMDHGRAGGNRRAGRFAGSIGFVSEQDGRRDAFATRAVHAGLTPDPTFGSVIPAIHQTSTYVQRRPGEFVEDYDYARSANPTRAALEQALGELEGGLAVAFASGLAAAHALITVACEAGSHIVLPGDLYGGTYRLVDKVLTGWGLSYDLVDQSDLDAVERAIRDETRLIWVESPTNPLLGVVDIERCRRQKASMRWSPWTTRSPPRSTSARSSWAPTSSCTRRPNISAATRMSSEASWLPASTHGTTACASFRTRSARYPGRWTASSSIAGSVPCS